MINKAQLQVTADSKQRLYLEINPVFTISYTGFVLGDNSSDLDILANASTTAVQNTDAGNYDITVSGGSDNNYYYVYNKGILTILKLDQVISFTDIPDGLRMTRNHQLVATATSGLAVTFESSDPGKVSIAGSTMTITGDGTSVIKATQAGNNN